MAYYLRQDKKKKGTYLQMYESYQDKEKKQPRSRNIESFGYVSDLISDEIPDPVSYYQKYVEKKNREHADSVADKTRPRAFSVQPEKKHRSLPCCFSSFRAECERNDRHPFITKKIPV